jgi:hypothetical protein
VCITKKSELKSRTGDFSLEFISKELQFNEKNFPSHKNEGNLINDNRGLLEEKINALHIFITGGELNDDNIEGRKLISSAE